MSEKKSWDIQPKRTTSPAPRPSGRQNAAPKPAVRAVVRKATQKAPSRANERLRDRRKKQRRIFSLSLGIFFVLVIAGLIYGIHRPAVRVTTIQVQGIHHAEITSTAQAILIGSYFHIIPKDSIFFFSASSIRSAILKDFPDIEAVSINRDSFSGITIIPTERSTAFLWCGTVRPPSGAQEYCYDADSDGLIFADASAADASTTVASTTQLANPGDEGATMKVYAALDTTAPTTASSSDFAGTDPIRAQVIHAETIPGAIIFTKALASLGAPVTYIVIRDDEADLYVAGGTRITYVLGHEVDAAALAEAVLPKVDISNGSILYLDLRFSGKAYIQRVGAPDQNLVSPGDSGSSTSTQ